MVHAVGDEIHKCLARNTWGGWGLRVGGWGWGGVWKEGATGAGGRVPQAHRTEHLRRMVWLG